MFYVTIPLLSELQNPDNTGGGTIITNLGVYISNIVGIVLIIASIVTFFYLAYGGLMWILSGGDKGKVEEARNRITNAIVGLAIVAASWAIFLLVDYFFGLNIAGGAGGGGNGGGGGGNVTCAADIPINGCGQNAGVWYRCLPANEDCNGNSYPYQFLCPDTTCP